MMKDIRKLSDAQLHALAIYTRFRVLQMGRREVRVPDGNVPPLAVATGRVLFAEQRVQADDPAVQDSLHSLISCASVRNVRIY